MSDPANGSAMIQKFMGSEGSGGQSLPATTANSGLTQYGGAAPAQQTTDQGGVQQFGVGLPRTGGGEPMMQMPQAGPGNYAENVSNGLLRQAMTTSGFGAPGNYGAPSTTPGRGQVGPGGLPMAIYQQMMSGANPQAALHQQLMGSSTLNGQPMQSPASAFARWAQQGRLAGTEVGNAGEWGNGGG